MKQIQAIIDGNSSISISLRVIIIYILMIIMIRISNKRFLGKHTAFDIIVGIVFGSMLSRAINGDAPFIETVVGGSVLLGIHWVFAKLSYETDFFGRLVKGDSTVLVRDGVIDWNEMKRNQITKKDLLESLRSKGIQDIKKIRQATFERNGDISIVL